MKHIFSICIIAASVFVTGCARVETGKVGIRIGWDKQVKMEELQPGSFSETILGDVLTFPITDISVAIDNITPITKDNSIMKNVDMTVVYSINPNHVSEIYANKNKSFHSSNNGDVLLMFNYMFQSAREELHKISREYEANEIINSRSTIEQKIRENIQSMMVSERLDGIIAIKQVSIRKMVPTENVVATSNNVVHVKNDTKQKEVDINTNNPGNCVASTNTDTKPSSITLVQESTEQMKVQAMLDAAKRGSLVMTPVDTNTKVQVAN